MTTFVDDTAIISTQNHLNEIEKRFSTWTMKVNETKSLHVNEKETLSTSIIKQHKNTTRK